MWIIAAAGSAFFAGLTSVLAKCGIKKTDSYIATAIRTGVVLLFSWIMVLTAGSFNTIFQISQKSFLFLGLSGIATGASWICYFKALSMGDVNKVVPIDKSGTILTIILAIIFFGETEALFLRLLFTAILGFGILLMIEKKDYSGENRRGWMIYAVLSAVFSAATSILAKIGIDGVESNLGTALRTVVVLLMAWVVVFMKGKQKEVKSVDKNELLFICLSGIATGASWLCYYYAIQNGVVSVVVPIDKLSIIVAVAFSYFVFGEKLNRKSALGLFLMTAATIGMAVFC